MDSFLESKKKVENPNDYNYCAYQILKQLCDPHEFSESLLNFSSIDYKTYYFLNLENGSNATKYGVLNSQMDMVIRESEKRCQAHPRNKSVDDDNAKPNNNSFRNVKHNQKLGCYKFIMYLDLTFFKGINSRFSEGAGDAFISYLAKYLLNTTAGKPEWVVTRKGGDEFHAFYIPQRPCASPATKSQKEHWNIRDAVEFWDKACIDLQNKELYIKVPAKSGKPDDSKKHLVVEADNESTNDDRNYRFTMKIKGFTAHSGVAMTPEEAENNAKRQNRKNGAQEKYSYRGNFNYELTWMVEGKELPLYQYIVLFVASGDSEEICEFLSNIKIKALSLKEGDSHFIAIEVPEKAPKKGKAKVTEDAFTKKGKDVEAALFQYRKDKNPETKLYRLNNTDYFVK